MHPLLQAKFDSLQASVTSNSSLKDIDQWIEKNTADPSGLGRFSFDGHEWQKAVVKSTHPHRVLRKSSQGGGSEIIVRYVLAGAAIFSGTHWMYALPTTGFASKFSASRVSPVIEASRLLKSMKSSAVSSNEMRGIGNSFLYFVGAQKEQQAISVPCRGVIRDEFDYGIPSVLEAFLSRLNHLKEDEKILIDISTPTVSAYGISAEFDEGSQHCYLCYHNACGTWVEVSAIDDIVIPKFDGTLRDFTPTDLKSGKYEYLSSYVKCSHCGGIISEENLCDPTRRAWVPKYLDREIESYEVDPLCVPSINTPVNIAKSRRKYTRDDKWVNFRLGRPYEDATNSIPLDIITNNSSVEPVTPDIASREGGRRFVSLTTFGLDVGKECHLVVLRDNRSGGIDMVWAERIRQTTDNEVQRQVLGRRETYGVSLGVTDAGPDITLQKGLIGAGNGEIFAGQFVNTRMQTEYYTFDEEEKIVSISRTRAITAFVKAVVAGEFKFMRSWSTGEAGTVVEHFRAMKKVEKTSEHGDIKMVWINTGPNHYFMAAFYAWVAMKLAEAEATNSGTLFSAGALGLSVVRLRDAPKEFDIVYDLAR